MIYCDVETTTHGKWILAGEHAVLRGHPALVFPIHEKQLTLRYHHTTSPLSVDFTDDKNINLHALLQRIIEHGMHILGQDQNTIQGHFQIKSNIPVGTGMGASAALCVAMARWFAAQQCLSSSWNIQSFAKALEHLFHGSSSGLDTTGVAAMTGIYFQQGSSHSIKQTWHPQWFLSTCNHSSMTSSCIKTVDALWHTDPSKAQAIDKQMHQCVLEALHALEEKNISKLANAINAAADCFQQWGLISNHLQQHMQQLRDAGAIAVKPTGSGGGGYVISLWEHPPLVASIHFISI